MILAGSRFLRRVEVHGSSMLPNLVDGDRLLVRPSRRVRIGDVVVVRDPEHRERLVVKRVRSVDGDLVTVLGDNAAASRDSRHYGPLPRRQLVGKAWWRYHPPERSGRLDRTRAPGSGSKAPQ